MYTKGLFKPEDSILGVLSLEILLCSWISPNRESGHLFLCVILCGVEMYIRRRNIGTVRSFDCLVFAFGT